MRIWKANLKRTELIKVASRSMYCTVTLRAVRKFNYTEEHCISNSRKYKSNNFLFESQFSMLEFYPNEKLAVMFTNRER